MLTVELITGDRVVMRKSFHSGRVSVGRSSEVDFVVPQNFDTVSRHHLTVVSDNGGCRIIDAGSGNGTLSQGRRIADQMMGHGGTVELGWGGPFLRVLLEPSLAGEVGRRHAGPVVPAPAASGPLSFVTWFTGAALPSRAFLSQVFVGGFRKRAQAEWQDALMLGQRTVVRLDSEGMVTPHPWIYLRVLATLLGAAILTWIVIAESGNPRVLPGFLILGASVVPVTVACFLWELNVWRNVSLWQVLFHVLIGGVLSIFVSLFWLFPATTFLAPVLGATLAGPVEEAGKLAAVVFLARTHGARRPSAGLVLGGAVGAGFALFESAGYAFEFAGEHLVQYGTWEVAAQAAYAMTVFRGQLAVFGHEGLTAITAGGLFRVWGRTGDLKLALQDRSFIRCFALSVLLHMAWNSALLQQFGILAILAIGAIMWTAVLSLVQQGVHDSAREIQRVR